MKNDKVAEPLTQQEEELSRNTSHHEIDFDGINEEALERPGDVIEWLELEGKQEGKYFVALNPKREDYGLGSFKINTTTGQWGDFAIEGASGGDLISLVAYLKDLPQGQAALELLDFLTNLDELYEKTESGPGPVEVVANSAQASTKPAQPGEARSRPQKKPHPDTAAKQVYPVTGVRRQAKLTP